MNCFLRRAPLRMVAMATIGSGLIYSNTASDSFRTSLQISAVPVPFRDTLQSSLMIIMQDMLPCPSFLSFDPSRYGNVPFIFPKFASAESAPPAGIKKAAAAPSSSEVGDSTKPCCGCLSRDTIANAAARIGPAVVNLSVPRGYHGLGVGKSMGSGTIIDKNGTILTCAHVVVHSQNLTTSSKGKVEVTLQDGRTFEGTVVNADVHSDIAIVKINSKTPLPTAKLGSSKKLRPGEWVVAVGCPLSLQNTVTAGIISCVDRKSSDLGIGGMRREYLQTDCAINAGNSGGPLVNIDGEVIGVNIMKVAAADGLGFSVPIDAASKIIEQFETKGRVVRPWLGLKMLDLNDMIIAQLKERDPAFPSVSKGVLVPVVIPGSPADRSGFCPGDVVVEFDGSPVQSINEITDILGDKVGKPLKVVVRRSNDTSATLTVIAEEANPDM